jgi:DNA-binding response OmpR family regulator
MPSPGCHRGKETPTASERRTILVVEDDADLLSMVQIALEHEGYEVESAIDGLNALQRVRRARPDLVVLDLNMPRMGGEDFLYAWRTGVEAPGVPVIVITAASQALRPQDLGVAACLPKPFALDSLLWHVRDLLAIPSQAPPQARAAAGRDPRDVEMVEVTEDLVAVMSTLLISVEQLATAPDLPDDLSPLATAGLDAAQRAAALTRRLDHLLDAPK